MQNIPNAGAMDAAAGGSGPSTMVLPWIVAAEPDQILRYATELTTNLTRVATLFTELSRLREQLRTAWPSGAASGNANAKLTSASTTFTKIMSTVQQGVAELRTAAELVRAFQTAYQTVVGSVNPTVASLMSNPYTQAAATSLAVSTTASLTSSMGGAKSALDAIGTTRIMSLVQSLTTILRDIQQLLAPASASGASTTPATTTPSTATGQPTTPGTGLPAGPATTLPAGPATTLPAGPATTLPAGSGGAVPQVVTLPDGRTAVVWPASPGNGTAPATGLPAPGTPSTMVGTGWIPIDQPTGGTGDVVVTTTRGDVTVTVDLPRDAAPGFDLDLDIGEGSTAVHEHIAIDDDGRVTVT